MDRQFGIIFSLMIFLVALATQVAPASGALLFEETFEGLPIKADTQGTHLTDWDVVEDPTAPEGPHVAKFGINGGYPSNAVTMMFLHPVDLAVPDGSNWALTFWHRYDMEAD